MSQFCRLCESRERYLDGELTDALEQLACLDDVDLNDDEARAIYLDAFARLRVLADVAEHPGQAVQSAIKQGAARIRRETGLDVREERR